MNWTVHKVINPIKQSHIDTALDGVCDHIVVGMGGHMVGEQDSFGPVTRFLECDDCYKAAKDVEGEELVYCGDCKKEHLKKNTIEWRWYDFYAPQGDEPLILCIECRKAPKHLARRARDEADKHA